MTKVQIVAGVLALVVAGLIITSAPNDLGAIIGGVAGGALYVTITKGAGD